MTALAERGQNVVLAHPGDYTREQVDLIKSTVAAGTSDLEFQMFMEVARTMGLSPLQKQIHAVMRWDNQEKRQKMVIQTGIDGYRLIAARTGAHLGTTDAVYGPPNKDGYPEWAQVTTKRLVHGQIAEFPATAFWDEYVQKIKEGTPNSMWRGRPRGQLGKCAEALALRKAFPAELSGVYSDIEMQQADSEAPIQQQARPDQRTDAEKLPPEVQDNIRRHIRQLYAEIKQGGVAEKASPLAEKYGNWKTDINQACDLRTDLICIAESIPLAAAEIVEAEVITATITDGQRKALMGQLKRLSLPNTTEARSAFYAWLVGTANGTRTNDLDTETAQGLIDTLSAMDPAEIEATAAQFAREVTL